MRNLLESQSLSLYGYFESNVPDDVVESLFFDNFLQESGLDYFGLSLFEEKADLLDLDGELFGENCNELELFAKFQLFCQRYNLKFVELNQ